MAEWGGVTAVPEENVGRFVPPAGPGSPDSIATGVAPNTIRGPSQSTNQKGKSQCPAATNAPSPPWS